MIWSGWTSERLLSRRPSRPARIVAPSPIRLRLICWMTSFCRLCRPSQIPMAFCRAAGVSHSVAGILQSESVRSGSSRLRTCSARPYRGTCAGESGTGKRRPTIAQLFRRRGYAFAHLQEEFTHRFNPLPHPLGRALAAAQRAVSGSAFESPRLSCALASVEFFRKEPDAFKSRRRGLLLLIRWMDSRLRTGGAL